MGVISISAVIVNLFFFLHIGMQSMKKYISIKFKSNFWSRICTFSRAFQVFIQYIGDFCLLIAILRWNILKILFQRLFKRISDFECRRCWDWPERETEPPAFSRFLWFIHSEVSELQHSFSSLLLHFEFIKALNTIR